jgi:hypothetical protein
MEKTMNRKTFLSALVLNGLVAAAAATLSMAPAPVRADDEPPAGCDYKQCSSPSACELALDRTNCLRNYTQTECITRNCTGGGGGDEM